MTANTTSNSRIDELFKAGAHFGFVRSRRHPTAKPFIFGVKNKIEIFDLERVSQELERVLEFVRKLGNENGTILLVGGKSEAREAIRRGGESLEMPYVAVRWIRGTLTNFPEIKKRIQKLDDLTTQREKGELAKYTKKERLLIDREIDNLHRFFYGVSTLRDMPKALFVIDSKREHIAVREAKRLGIPVIALSGSDCDLSEVEYSIPGNDASVPSIQYFVDQVVRAYKEGKTPTTK